MEFSMDESIVRGGGGGGGALAAIMGALMTKDDGRGDRGMLIAALVVVLIIFFIAIIIIAFAFMRDGRRHEPVVDYRKDKTDLAEIMAVMMASKMGNEGKAIEHVESRLLEKMEHGEDRAVARETQKEIQHQGTALMQMGFGLSGQVHETEKTGLKNFATLEAQIGTLMQGVNTLLQERNNDAIVDKMMMRMWGNPCAR